MTLDASVSMTWVKTVLATAERQGVAATRLLAQAKLPANALARARWPIDYITRLWRAAEQCTHDPAFGLRVGREVSPASVGSVVFALQSAATLREALLLLQKYQRLISDGGRFQLLPGDTASWVVYHPCQGQLAFSPYQVEAVLASVVTLSRWITGTHMLAERVQFSQARLGAETDYANAFGCAVAFDCAFNGLQVSNGLLDQPLPQADAELAELHERVSRERLLALTGSTTQTGLLRRWLDEQLGPKVPRRAQAALALGIGERTLARRLAAEGTSFDQLLDEARRQLAFAAVLQGERQLADVAQALGFAEVSTFYRAFQRWAGMPPGQWRRAQHQIND